MIVLTLSTTTRYFGGLVSILFLILVPLFRISQAQPSADEPSEVGSVVLVSSVDCCPDKAWPEAETAIRNELAMLGVPIEVVPGAAADEIQMLVEHMKFAETKNAAAALRILRSTSTQGLVGIWISDRVNGKTTYRPLRIDNIDDPDAAIIAAVRTVEALRASLIESRIESDHSPTVRRSPQIDEFIKSTPITDNTRHRVGFSGGTAICGSPGGVGIRGGFLLGLDWRPTDHGGVAVEGLYFLFGDSVSTDDRASSLNMLLLRGSIVWHIGDTGLFRPALSLGGGGLVVYAEGQKGDELTRRSDITRVGYGGTGASLQLAFSDPVRLELGCVIGLTFPEVRLYHGTQKAAVFGLPLLDGWLKLVVRP